MLLKVKKQLNDMLRRIKVETEQLLFDMLGRINVVEKVKKQLIDMLRRIKVETTQLLFDMLRRMNVVESDETLY